jgi:hypothetical protein
VKEGIFRTVWELKKEGYAEATVAGYGENLKIFSKIAIAIVTIFFMLPVLLSPLCTVICQV